MTRKEYIAEWQAAHHDAVRAAKLKYARKKNARLKAERAERKARRFEENLAYARREQRRKWDRQDNPPSRKERDARYYQNHKEEIRRKQADYRERKATEPDYPESIYGPPERRGKPGRPKSTKGFKMTDAEYEAAKGLLA